MVISFLVVCLLVWTNLKSMFFRGGGGFVTLKNELRQIWVDSARTQEDFIVVPRICFLNSMIDHYAVSNSYCVNR